MPPKKTKSVCEPFKHNIRWVDGWSYHVYEDGLVRDLIILGTCVREAPVAPGAVFGIELAKS